MPETIGNIIASDLSAMDQPENRTRRGHMFRRISGQKRYGNERGVTLIEIIVVIGLIGILAGIGTTMLMRELPNIRLKEASRELFNDIQSARMHAVRRGLVCDVRPQASGYTLVLVQHGADIVPPLKSVDFSNYGGVRWGSINGDAPNPDSGTFTNDRLRVQPSGMTNSGAFYLRGGSGDLEGRRIDVSVLGRPVISTWDKSSSTYKKY